MRDKRQLCIGLSLSATWRKGKAGQSEESGAKQFSSHFYVELAKMAERAKLDFLFKPDALYLHADGNDYSPRFASLDPTVMLAAIARETERIGMVTTASTTFNPPFVVARQLQSLHWLTNGRAGWNIVTSLGGKRAGQAMGLNVFTLFVGFGLGSLIFGALLRFGFGVAFGLFAVVELILAVLSFALFRSEVPSRAVPSATGVTQAGADVRLKS